MSEPQLRIYWLRPTEGASFRAAGEWVPYRAASREEADRANNLAARITGTAWQLYQGDGEPPEEA